MRVLYIASNPADQPSLRIEEEANELQMRIDSVQTSGQLDLRIYSKLRIADLPQTIARVQPDIIHFSAHGEFEGILLSHGSEEVLLMGEDLVAILSALKVRPKLIVVNACSSEVIAQTLTQVANFTIGTTAPITNDGAIVMAATLYQHLASSATVEQSFVAAQAMLRAVDSGKVTTKLFSAPGQTASMVRLNEAFRIIAALPKIDKLLKSGGAVPKFKGKDVEVEFGIADAPAGTIQVVFFTDDSTVTVKKGGSLEKARSWLQEIRPNRGEHWIEPTFEYYGDMQWYAAIVTSVSSIYTAASTTCDALERYYFEERWPGELSVEVCQLITDIIAWLRSNDGTRRAEFAASPVTKSDPG